MSFVQNMAIKHKLMLIIMVTCTVALLLYSAIHLLTERGDFRKETIDSISCYAEMIGDNCRAALAFGDAEDAQETLKSHHAESSIIFACVYTKERKILAGYQRVGLAQNISSPACEEEGYRFEENYFKLYEDVKDSDELVGTVYIQLDLSEGKARLWLKAGMIGLGLLACSLMAYIVSLSLQRVISGPILSLAEVAKVVSEKEDYSIHRAPGATSRRGADVEQ